MIPRVGRENLVPPTPPSTAQDPKRRISTVMSSGRRRSGMGRKSVIPPGAPAMVDPRPVSNKAYQQECIKELFSFLQKSGYEHPISHKSLSRPSGRDFSNIVTFMLRRIDPTFQDGTLKMEDEVAMNFKAMGYPFAVSKTALVAAGSPHTWPTLLAALTWLMKRVQCMECLVPNEEENRSKEFDSVEELEGKTDRYFFTYLSASYTAFLKGDEKLREELEMGLADRLEGDDNILIQDIEQMTDQNAAIVEKMNSLSLGDKDLEELVKKRDSYATDLEQFHDLIEQMDQHVETLEEKKNNQSEELEETNKSLAKIMSKVEQVKDSIGKQELSVDDVKKMQSERKGVEEAMERALALRDQRRSALWEIESELDKTMNDLESVVTTYNSNVCDLKLVPMVSSKGIEMEAVINKESILDPDPSKLLSIDLPTTIHPTLSSCCEEYVSLISNSKWKYQEALDQLEKSEAGFTEALERHRIVENKIDKCEETMKAEREAQDAKLGVRTREVELIERKVASLRDPVALEEQMSQFERQCTELETMRQQHEEDNIARKKAICEEIDGALLAMKDYDDFCLEKIKEVQKYRENKRVNYGALSVPVESNANLPNTEEAESNLVKHS